MDSNLLENIKRRREKLFLAKKELKKHFVGIDPIIDKIISNIETWYVMPDLITRPVIINLWGLTGVGKTDLVRRLVKYLEFEDKFVEIQLTNKGSSSDKWATSIQAILTGSNLETKTPGILLLDEIQRFRAIDQNFQEIHDYEFQDLWMLLSDGKFSGSHSNKIQLLQMFYESLYYSDYTNNDDEEEDEVQEPMASAQKNKKKKKRIYKQSYYSAQRMKKYLKLDDEIEDIMKWDEDVQFQVINDKMKDKRVYEGDDYSKLLVIVSGNLDEAYAMSRSSDDIDTDADKFYEFSTKINIINIKQALAKRFKPEHISRLGNVHIIYPSLREASYKELIKRRVNDIISNIKTNFGINIKIDNSVHELIYRNGVFPAQGTRPLFSSISSILENIIPFFLLKSIENQTTELTLSYTDKSFVGVFGGDKNTSTVPFEGDIDVLRREKDIDHITSIAVHEAGHAVAYALLLKITPTQISANAVSSSDGFIGIHAVDGSEKYYNELLQVYLAGMVAEEIMFGSEYRTAGCEQDLFQATSMAGRMIRRLGMSKNSPARVVLPIESISEIMVYDEKNSNHEISEILSEKKNEVCKLLQDNIELLKELSEYLIEHKTILPNDYKEMLTNYGIEVDVLSAKQVVRHKYHRLYRNNNVSEEIRKSE